MTRLWLIALALGAGFAGAVHADEDAAAAQGGAAHERRIGQLEKENRELRDRLERVEQRDTDDQRTMIAEAVQDYEEQSAGVGLNMLVRRNDITAMFQIFGHVGAVYSNPEKTNRSNTFFFNGSVDFFMSAKIGDHFQVLSETVFQSGVGIDSDSSGFDQERLWGAWRFSDAVQVKFGLEHSPISLWNRVFHHGAWLELTISRPFLARFEAGGGILPMHNAGIEITGSFPTAAGRASYFVVVSNGRGPGAADVQEFSDRNDHKAVTLGLALEPARVEGLKIWLFWRVDEAPPDTDDPARARPVRIHMFSFQLQYEGEKFEVLSEVLHISNDDRTGGTTFEHWAAYVQVGYLLNDRWTPFLRVGGRWMDRGDPYYAPLNRDLDIFGVVLGVRFDFLDNVAMKLEIGAGEQERRRGGSSTIDEGGYIVISYQLSWIF